MQPDKKENELEPATPHNSLDRCLVDGDAAAMSSGRRRRRKALAISFAIESAALALLIAVPILTGVAQPNPFRSTSGIDFLIVTHPHDAGQYDAIAKTHPVNHPAGWIPFTAGKIPRHLKPVTEDAADNADGGEEWIIGQAGNDVPTISNLSLANPVLPPPSTIKKPEEKRPLKMSEGVEQAQLISRIEPRYPALAAQIKMEGTVVLHAIISRDGSITALNVISGSPYFVKAALDAVHQWRYRPTFLNGEPVEVETTITVIFRLQQ
ncbi:MAG: energy transducer TonB [Acidobacteriia bacterium]|nr:energy transducer TonB [Terriglobia bacterium]